MLSKEMQEKLMGEIKRRDKFIELIGIKIIEADEGYCKAELKVDDRHLNRWERCMADACTHWRIQSPVLLRPHVVLRAQHFQAICIFSDRQWV